MSTRARLTRRGIPVKFQSVLPERPRAEAIHAGKLGVSADAAHMQMLRARDVFETVVESVVEAGQWNRMPTFTARVDQLLARRPVLALADAVARKAHADGAEDGDLTAFALNLADEKLARGVYRELMAERGAIDDLLIAIAARFGWSA